MNIRESALDVVDEALAYLGQRRAEQIAATGCGDAYEFSLLGSLCAEILRLRQSNKDMGEVIATHLRVGCGE